MTEQEDRIMEERIRPTQAQVLARTGDFQSVTRIWAVQRTIIEKAVTL